MNDPKHALRFCPRCGKGLRGRLFERKHPLCGACGYIQFQNPHTAVSLFLERRGKLLFSRRARAPRKGFLGVVGGFMEFDEEPQDAARREAMEEAGIRVSGFRLVGAYHEWYGFQGVRGSTITLYYTARFSGTPVAASDAASFEWHDPATMKKSDLAFPHMRKALRDFLHVRKERLV